MLIRLDNADYLSPFTKSVIRGYEHKQNKRQQQEDKYSILPNIFLISKESILVEFPYCPQNELVARRFQSKFHQFNNQKFQVTIKWISKKVKTFFSLKDKNPYPAWQIYKGTCVFDQIYIGKTIRIVHARWNQHEDIRKEFEPTKHLRENLNHIFKWEALLQAPKNYRQRKILKLLLQLLCDQH